MEPNKKRKGTRNLHVIVLGSSKRHVEMVVAMRLIKV